MHILTFILLFVVGAIAAACKGDMSGIAAIGEIFFGIIGTFLMMWLLCFHFLFFAITVISIFAFIIIWGIYHDQ